MVSCCSRISKLFFFWNLWISDRSGVSPNQASPGDSIRDLFGMFMWPFSMVSRHLKLGDEKVTAWITCHLATLFSFSVLFRVPLDLLRPSSKQKLRWRSHHPDWAHHHFGGLGRVCARCFRGNSELLMAWSWVNRCIPHPTDPSWRSKKLQSYCW